MLCSEQDNFARSELGSKHGAGDELGFIREREHGQSEKGARSNEVAFSPLSSRSASPSRPHVASRRLRHGPVTAVRAQLVFLHHHVPCSVALLWLNFRLACRLYALLSVSKIRDAPCSASDNKLKLQQRRLHDHTVVRRRYSWPVAPFSPTLSLQLLIYPCSSAGFCIQRIRCEHL